MATIHQTTKTDENTTAPTPPHLLLDQRAERRRHVWILLRLRLHPRLDDVDRDQHAVGGGAAGRPASGEAQEHPAVQRPLLLDRVPGILMEYNKSRFATHIFGASAGKRLRGVEEMRAQGRRHQPRQVARQKHTTCAFFKKPPRSCRDGNLLASFVAQEEAAPLPSSCRRAFPLRRSHLVLGPSRKEKYLASFWLG